MNEVLGFKKWFILNPWVSFKLSALWPVSVLTRVELLVLLILVNYPETNNKCQTWDNMHTLHQIKWLVEMPMTFIPSCFMNTWKILGISLPEISKRIPNLQFCLQVTASWKMSAYSVDPFEICDLNINPTLSLGDFDTTPSMHCHILLQCIRTKKPPVMIGTFLIHYKKDFQTYHFFASSLLQGRSHGGGRGSHGRPSFCRIGRSTRT